MHDLETIELKKLPALGPQMMGALLARKPGLERGGELPLISNWIGSVSLDSARLARMRALCQIPDGACLPPTALHILAAPLHIALLTDKRVPIKAMGIAGLETSSNATEPTSALMNKAAARSAAW